MKYSILPVLSVLAILSIEGGSARACDERTTPSFTCRPNHIHHSIDDAVINGCADTITLCMGLPIPPRHVDSEVDAPIRVYRIYDGPSGRRLERRSVELRTDTTTGLIHVIPDDRLEIHDAGVPDPARYRLVVDCQYWYGTERQDTIRIELWKQYVVRAFATARSLTDSTDLSDQIMVTPLRSSDVHYELDGVNIAADAGNDHWTFDHWTASNNIALDPDAAQQHLKDVCWPLQDTVIFTAWYRTTSTGVAFSRRDGRIKNVNHSNGQITFTHSVGSATVATVVDVTGRLISHTLLSAGDQHMLTLDVPAGLYFLVLSTGNEVVTEPLTVNY